MGVSLGDLAVFVKNIYVRLPSFEVIEDDKKRGDSGIILNIWLTETASGRLVFIENYKSGRTRCIVVYLLNAQVALKVIRDERFILQYRAIRIFVSSRIPIREFFIIYVARVDPPKYPPAAATSAESILRGVWIPH